jgi:hypothetical protein
MQLLKKFKTVKCPGCNHLVHIWHKRHSDTDWHYNCYLSYCFGFETAKTSQATKENPNMNIFDVFGRGNLHAE